MRATRFLGCARLLASLLVSYTASPLGIKCFQAWYAAIGRELDALDSRDQFCFSEQSLAATDPSSGFKFLFTQATLETPASRRDDMASWTPTPGGVLR